MKNVNIIHFVFHHMRFLERIFFVKSSLVFTSVSRFEVSQNELINLEECVVNKTWDGEIFVFIHFGG